MTAHGYTTLSKHGKGDQLGLYISAPISRSLIGAGLIGSKFRCELTEDGILFRFADAAAPQVVTLPAWAKGNGHA